MDFSKAILLGTGVLTWWISERKSDRYGTVVLQDQNSWSQKIYDNPVTNIANVKNNLGRKGKLICEIVDTRESTHIGDMTYDIFPSTPNKGDKIKIGDGTLFMEEGEGQIKIGLRPIENRGIWWLDPKALYRVHEQTVNLYFLPA